MYDCIIIGCGIVGAAAAYELSRYRLSIAVLEKENDVASGTTKANSAILHAGYDPLPGTRMARLNVQGSRLAAELCQKLDVPYKRTGSLVVAFSEEERATLRALYERGMQNGVPGLELLDGIQARALEPNLSAEVTGALRAPTAAIVSPWDYALALMETAVLHGARLFTGRAVTAIERIAGGYRLHTASGVFEARCILNAAGVHADTVHNLIAPPAFTIQPNRGQYYLLDKSEGTHVSHVVFQCPTKEGKGVLVAPTVHGNLIVGPNAEDIPNGDDCATTRAGLDFVARAAARTAPSLSLRASIRNFAGVRAVVEGIDDFIIGEAEGAPGFIDLAGIKSPGLTAAPAIAREAAHLLAEAGLKLEKRDVWIDERRVVRFRELPQAEKTALIRKNPLYGRVICRCERITEGEIVAALHAPVPARSIDGVKRRVNAGMGRCQGGFCSPRVHEIIARELGLDPRAVLQDAEGSYLLTGETKTGGALDAGQV